ncbi:MAG: glycosyltransferase [Cytophagales bacterium]|nr:glycosyltransferase [Cytophaga sp.]
MLADGMKKRGHQVTMWAPKARVRNLPAPAFLKKWLGYIDQYVVFPMEVRKRIKKYSKDTLFVFTDHALGPWIPLVADRPHAVHCHDFLAQRSALGQIEENKTGWSGKKYQSFIHRGYSRGRHFISVSEKTRQDLKEFLPVAPLSSDMVYNGLNQSFSAIDSEDARRALGAVIGISLDKGFLLHVGGNQWYKNRKGVIELYNAWRASQQQVLPLLLIGFSPDQSLVHVYEDSPYKKDIHLVTGLNDETVRMAYAGASVFLFPSLAEGFGWPIAEAMASGCPVITTDVAPMTEVAGDAAVLIPVKTTSNAATWPLEGAKKIEQVLNATASEQQQRIAKGIENAKRFNTEGAMDEIEKIYLRIVHKYK